MKKEEFVKLGIDEELAKKCELASLEELKGFIPKTRFDEVNNEKKKLELDVRDRDTQLESLKNSSGDAEALKKQIEELQDANKTKDEAHAAEIKQLKVNSAVEAALRNADAKNIKAVRALLDLENAELDDAGTIKGLDDQIKKLVEAEDSKFLFGQTTVSGAHPAESGDKGNSGANLDPKAKAAMSYDEIVSLYEGDSN